MKYTTYFSICLALRRKKVYTLITVHSGKVVWKKDQIDNMEEEMKKMVKGEITAFLSLVFLLLLTLVGALLESASIQLAKNESCLLYTSPSPRDS